MTESEREKKLEELLAHYIRPLKGARRESRH